ncbi:zinc-binding alcohol dehydrogenase [Sphingobium sp.]|uniref:zinc-dependent alcohol dehydrogenase n=1 Tax=Sphingobium sp. TaxID=1912891 RepID=UPI0028BDCDBA|nr:zinc-binding alcohol dehydrogenase [Sphingobium sp.]
MSNSLNARALWFEGPRHAALRDEEAKAPGAGEIRVRAIHSMVSPGSEMNVYRGEGNLPSVPLPTMAGTLPFPIKFGYQVVGRVEAAGEGSGFEPGDLVFAAHPHQDVFTMPAVFGVKLPSDIDTVRAGFMNMCTVALRTVHEAPIRVGEVVALSGLGIIGSLTAHLVRKSAGKLILIDPAAERRARSAWIGADAVVDPSEVAAVVAELSQGRGVDTFIETSGAPPALQTAITHTGERGSVVVPAWYGTRPVNLSLSPEFHLRALTIKSVFVGSVGGDELARWTDARRFETALDIVQGIDPANLISQRLPFERAAEAYRLLDENPGQAPAVILDY